MDREVTEFNLESYAHSEDIPEPPEEFEESEKAMAELTARSLDDKYSFINIVVLAVVLLACASYFLTMTSSKRYGDEGNKFSLERLANGKYTAEISRRYYSTIAYPEELTELSDSISSLYGVLDRSTAEQVRENTERLLPSDNSSGNGGGSHNEKEINTETGSGTGTETSASHYVETFYDTMFSRTTTIVTTLNFDPEDPYSRKTTTTINTAPDVKSTTTAVPTQTTAQTVSSEETTPSETEPTQTETETTPSETTPSETESSASETESSVEEEQPQPEADA
ncbi:MAG: hypothetical protein IJ561_09005 [Ruminococcus sp.]|nr:hypothetical protein [Ruminococcus sp.]MBR1393957.1 hypothetical protein [Ruminococcus sp.]